MYPGIATRKECLPRATTATQFKELKSPDQVCSLITPAANILEFPTEYLIRIAVPGLQNEDFNIDLAEGVITISVQKEIEMADVISNRCEYDFHDWTRAFVLPPDSDALLITATYKNGELCIHIPRNDSAETSNPPFAVYVY